MSANNHRGEVEIKLEGETLLMRPTFAALNQIEQRTGSPLLELLVRFNTGRFRLMDVIATVTAGFEAAGTSLAEERVAKMVWKSGYQTCVAPAAALLACIWTANLTEDDEAGLAATANQEGENAALGESSRVEG